MDDTAADQDVPSAVAHEAPEIARLGTLAELTLGGDVETGPDFFAQFQES